MRNWTRFCLLFAIIFCASDIYPPSAMAQKAVPREPLFPKKVQTTTNGERIPVVGESRETQLLKKELQLLKKENELLKKENELLRKELAEFKKTRGSTSTKKKPIVVNKGGVEFKFVSLKRYGTMVILRIAVTSKANNSLNVYRPVVMVAKDGKRFTEPNRSPNQIGVVNEGITKLVDFRVDPLPPGLTSVTTIILPVNAKAGGFGQEGVIFRGTFDIE